MGYTMLQPKLISGVTLPGKLKNRSTSITDPAMPSRKILARPVAPLLGPLRAAIKPYVYYTRARLILGW